MTQLPYDPPKGAAPPMGHWLAMSVLYVEEARSIVVSGLPSLTRRILLAVNGKYALGFYIM